MTTTTAEVAPVPVTIPFSRVFATTNSWAPLVARVFLGVAMFAHGAQKVLGVFGGQGLKGTIAFMGGLGIPPWLAVVEAFTEFAGGLCLLAGFFVRFWSIGTAIAMTVAIALVHAPKGYFDSEKPLLLIGLSLVVLIAGAGRASVDRALARRAS